MWPNNRILLETDISFSRKESTWHAISVSGYIRRQARCKVEKTFVKLSVHSQRQNYYRATPKIAQTNWGAAAWSHVSSISSLASIVTPPRRPAGGLGIGSVQHGAGSPTPSLSLCLMLCPGTRPPPAWNSRHFHVWLPCSRGKAVGQEACPHTFVPLTRRTSSGTGECK